MLCCSGLHTSKKELPQKNFTVLEFFVTGRVRSQNSKTQNVFSFADTEPCRRFFAITLWVYRKILKKGIDKIHGRE